MKILMEQDYHAERFKEFLREVCRRSNLVDLKIKPSILKCCICLLLLGCNNEAPATSEYCSFYGCSHSASKLVHSDRIFIQVPDFFLVNILGQFLSTSSQNRSRIISLFFFPL